MDDQKPPGLGAGTLTVRVCCWRTFGFFAPKKSSKQNVQPRHIKYRERMTVVVSVPFGQKANGGKAPSGARRVGRVRNPFLRQWITAERPIRLIIQHPKARPVVLVAMCGNLIGKHHRGFRQSHGRPAMVRTKKTEAYWALVDFVVVSCWIRPLQATESASQKPPTGRSADIPDFGC